MTTTIRKASKKAPQSKSTAVANVRKGDTSALVVNGADAFPEDVFVGTYYTGGQTGDLAILEPSFKPGTLIALSQQNNALAQCIAAMEVNVDGTGHTIDKIEGAADDEKEKELLTSFFKEPYPGQSMITIRRRLRRDLEATGNAYLEILRNVKDEVLMLNYLEADYIRLIRYDDPVQVDKVVMRGGQELKVKIRTRERKYVMLINGKKTYFKEFGGSRDVDRLTGAWQKEGTDRLPIDVRGSEILHFTVNREPKTPYGAARWLNQIPSVLGSRKAEEFNLEFFDAGGLPPVLLMVQGGYLGDQVKEDLVAHLSNKGNKHRAVIIEAISSSGSMDSSGSVQLKVERFGADRMNDAMFQSYDKNCAEHIRTSFRLPQMFIGQAGDLNFASAYTAYMIAEAQVFFPERDEFDTIINNTVVKALGAKSYRFRSLPLTLVDVANQLKAVELVNSLPSGAVVSGEETVSVLNEITGLSLTYTKPPEPPAGPEPKTDPLTGLPYDKPVPPQHPTEEYPNSQSGGMNASGTPSGTISKPARTMGSGKGTTKLTVVKDEIDTDLIVLADQWATMLGLSGDGRELSYEQREIVKKEVSELTDHRLKIFNEVLATKSLHMMGVDAEGLGELSGCAAHLQG